MEFNLLFKVTSECNQKCKYCYRDFEKVYDYNNTSIINNLLSILKSRYISRITFTGGEPTTYKNLKLLINLFVKYKNLIVLTNGIKLLDVDEKVLKYIDLVVSLDGDKDVMKKNRGVNFSTFETIIDNIKLYISKCKSVTINTVLTKYNLYKSDYYPYKIFGSKILYNISVPSLIYTPNDYVIDCSKYDKAYNLILKYIEESNYKMNCNTNLIYSDIFIFNKHDIVKNMVSIEYRMETNTFHIFDKICFSLDEAILFAQNIVDKILVILENYIKKKNTAFLFDPYSTIEKIIFEKGL